MKESRYTYITTNIVAVDEAQRFMCILTYLPNSDIVLFTISTHLFLQTNMKIMKIKTTLCMLQSEFSGSVNLAKFSAAKIRRGNCRE